MVHYLLKSILLCSLLSFFIGCSLDRVQIISQPSTAKPGDTISVLYTDIYLIISTTPATSQAYSRDSLHVAYGLPAGWSVVSSDYYVATGIKLSQMASIATTPALLAILMQDSLATYTQRKLPMTKDAGWGAYFTGKTFEAHNIDDNDSIPINGSAVGQWLAYSSKISLSVPKGAKMDTGVSLSSLPIDSVTRGRITMLYQTDSIWVKAIPVVCFAQLVARQASGTDTLLYFSKTGPKPGPSSPLIPNFDKGDMTYAPITISLINAAKQLPALRRAEGMLRVYQNFFASGTVVKIDVNANAAWNLSIYDVAGKTVRQFRGPSMSTIAWDKTTSSGSRVNPGTYVARLETQGQNVSQTMRIVK